MHEVSFQDKEKEHLTRLQDAEEVKVSARLFAVHTSGNICAETLYVNKREERNHDLAFQVALRGLV